ncbi:MAG: hypothetical protein WD275_03650, partial [Rhodothermales bacterium]
AEPRRAISRRTAGAVIDMMRGVVSSGGTGGLVRTRYGLRGDLAGKTGTTHSAADGWFVLVHPEIVTGGWVGFHDQRITFRTTYWGQGGHNALHVVGDFARSASLADFTFRATARFDAPTYSYRLVAAASVEDGLSVPVADNRPAGTTGRLSW